MKTANTAKKNAENATTYVIKPVDLRTVRVRIVGTSPLIVHAFAEKEKRRMLDDMQSTTKVKKKRENRIPMADAIGSLYWLEGRPDIDLENLPREDVNLATRMCEEAFEKAIGAYLEKQ